METKADGRPWWTDGLHFSCTGCGKCCTGETGYVWVAPEEIEEMSAFLELEVAVFVRRFVRRVGSRLALREEVRWVAEPHIEKMYDCVFLQDGRTCQVYAARPKQCRKYPFWKDVMESPKSWERESYRCEGIHVGGAPNITAEAMAQVLEG